MAVKEDIALVGMACRFPGIAGCREYWNQFVHGLKTGSGSTKAHDKSNAGDKKKRNEQRTEKQPPDHGSLKTAEGAIFDSAAYHEALEETIDKCIADTGGDAETFSGRKTTVLSVRSEHMPDESGMQDILGALGPAGNGHARVCDAERMLTALNKARKMLLLGESDLAIVLGSHLPDTQPPDAANAHIGAFLLTTHDCAVEMKMSIHAILKGTAVNPNTHACHLNAPQCCVDGHRGLIEAAHHQSKVEMGSLDYFEIHQERGMLDRLIEAQVTGQCFHQHMTENQHDLIKSIWRDENSRHEESDIEKLVRILLITKNHKELIDINDDNSISSHSAAKQEDIFRAGFLGLYGRQSGAYAIWESVKQKAPGKPKSATGPYFYKPVWQPTAVSNLPINTDHQRKVAVIFMDEAGLGDALQTLLIKKGLTPITVSPGKTYEKRSAHAYGINLLDPDNYTSLFRDVFREFADTDQSGQIVSLYFLVCHESADPGNVTVDGLRNIQQKSLLPLFLLAQTLAAGSFGLKFNLMAVTRNNRVVSGQDIAGGYAHGAIAGLLQAVGTESDAIRTRHIDVDASGSMAPIAEKLFMDELIISDKTEFVAYRNDQRFVQRLEAVEMGSDAPPLGRRKNGVYLVVGGLGSLGFEAALMLAKTAQPTVVIIGRSQLNDQKKAKLIRLNERDAEVFYLSTDVGNQEKMAQLFKTIKDRYGRVDGVICSAGPVHQPGLISEKPADAFLYAVTERMAGLITLDQLLGSEALDFFIVFSSLSSMVGMSGLADFSAASSLTDAFVRYRSARHPSEKTIGINWPLWKDSDRGTDSGHLSSWKSTGIQPLDRHAGERALKLIFNSPPGSQVAVCGSRLGAAHAANGAAVQQKPENPSPPRTGNPAKSPRIAGSLSRSRDRDIAIIGMAGRFPGAKTIGHYWENIKSGTETVRFFSREELTQAGIPESELNRKNYVRAMPWLDGIDCFDAGFFGYSAQEARQIDPQQRMLLECAWHALEDAGYPPRSIRMPVGVFLSVFFNLYADPGAKMSDSRLMLSEKFKNFVSSDKDFAATRIAYKLNLTGPAMTIQTACSSALVSAHVGCQSLLSGESDMVLAGGANLILPQDGGYLHEKNFLYSEDGHCRVFDKRASGTIFGNGLGIVVLKKLDRAVADGDSIYAVITGSAINNDGAMKADYMAPSHQGQNGVILKALERANINPETIQLLEAHGTGTKIGDPLEIGAITAAYRRFTDKKMYCAVGSVKSNIGHLNAAAGVAGIMKAALCLKHGQIPPAVNFTESNPEINFEESPFYINSTLKAWPADAFPRRAGVSAFGIGGTNAHMVLEEYSDSGCRDESMAVSRSHPVIVVLSAKNPERLKEQARQLLDEIERRRFSDNSLAEIAYTLQVGREVFEERLAVITSGIDSLKEKLRAFITDQASSGDLVCGHVNRNENTLSVFSADKDLKKAIDVWIDKKKYTKLIKLWVRGLNIDWHRLYGNVKPRRISLPPYPFARERHWVPRVDPLVTQSPTAVTQTVIHPLIHENTSDLSEQRYTTSFTGEEFFLADHVIGGRRVLPGVAQLEMARAAMAAAAGALNGDQRAMRLKNIAWRRPVSVDARPATVHIGLLPEDDGSVAYTVYGGAEKDPTSRLIYSRGMAEFASIETPPALDLPALKSGCSRGELSAGECYEAFQSMGIAYGPGHRGLQRVYRGEGHVLARLALPDGVRDTKDQFLLHPSIMDSALQGAIGLLNGDKPTRPSVPVALGQLDIIDRLQPAMWASIRYGNGGGPESKTKKIDIDLCDDTGRICVQLKGLAARELAADIARPDAVQETGMLMLRRVWTEQTASQGAAMPAYDGHVVMIIEADPEMRRQLDTPPDKTRYVFMDSDHKQIDRRFGTHADKVLQRIQRIIREKPRDRVLIQVVTGRQGDGRLFSGISGLLKTARKENPQIVGQLIELASQSDWEDLLEKLTESACCPEDQEIQYQGGKRRIAGWKSVEIPEGEASLPWKEAGVYLITGGTGGLGRIFAEEITQRAPNAKLILTGRSRLGDARRAWLKKMTAAGAHIDYRQVDVTRPGAVDGLIQDIRDQFGSLHGILHAAGVIHDGFILNKEPRELTAVLAPKVTGLVNLDRASAQLDLDFFVLFSSVAGIDGNVGQADYAAANAFMDAYARYRADLVRSKQRRGRTLSINWPMWKAGGMQMEENAARSMMARTGLVAMETPDGIQAFYRSLAADAAQVAVLPGDLHRLQEVFLKKKAAPAVSDPTAIVEENVPTIAEDVLREKALDYFKSQFSAIVNVPAHRIDTDAPMEKFGIDSIMIIQLTNQLEKIFGPLSKTLFFEFQSIGELVDYFIGVHSRKLSRLLKLEQSGQTSVTQAKDFVPVKADVNPRGPARRVFPVSAQTRMAAGGALDIAVIGLSGRYPGARDVDEFWENLKAGRDCITEIPKDRWDYGPYFDEDKSKPGKTYSKWGGFIDGVDQFDPLFFNISPREATIMDPQERLFLQCVYETLEDAGYTRESIGRYHGNVGVYAGVMYEEYQLFGAQETVKGRPTSLSGVPSSIANRVSYFFDLHGPSMAVDTMCSSSLTTIHLACQSLTQGECEMAIAGGVNVSIHPNKYLLLGQGKFVSSTGRCESFGQGGDGYVPGEGVGAVLLKPLPRAIADADHIYGVIKATAINHGGRTNGYTVPNPRAQAGVIGRALDNARINPRAISYIEAHGTGTSLGDPIEIAGLTKSFRQHTTDRQYCAIGSAKSNIGHCESAAGIAGLTKVLLQMKHGQLVPSLHSETLNPHVDFTRSPFTVQQSLADWKRPLITRNGKTAEYPRLAGISSFGAGGSNAHLIVEEYRAANRSRKPDVTGSNSPVMIVLSAKSEDRLKAAAKRLQDAIVQIPLTNDDLGNMAYTLQVGREAMKVRLAFQADSIDMIHEKLGEFVDGRDNVSGVYQGVSGRNPDASGESNTDGEIRSAVDEWIIEGNSSPLLNLWIKGAFSDWRRLYDDEKPLRISLPTYPFEKKRYWFSETKDDAVEPEKKDAGEIREDVEVKTEKAVRPNVVHDYGKNQIMQEIKDFVLKKVSEILLVNRSDIDSEVEMADYGFDSISLTRMINEIRNHYGDNILPEDVFRLKTVNELVAYVSSKMDTSTHPVGRSDNHTGELRREPPRLRKSTLDYDRNQNRLLNFTARHAPALSTEKILLNGATGVLGGRLIKDLLEMTESRIYCLVRGKSREHGRKRLMEMLTVHDPMHTLASAFQERVVVLVGEITHEYLGLGKESYEDLTQKIDLVIHNASKISLHGIYEEVENVNVNGTSNMISFALKTRQKYFLYVSSFTVMGDRYNEPVEPFKETDFDLGQGFQHLGYARSKFEAERQVRLAYESGLKWIIVRPGNIMGDSEFGYYPLGMTGITGIYYDMIKSAIEMKATMKSRQYFDITPVNYVSKGIVYLGTYHKMIYDTYHLVNPDLKSYDEVISIVKRCGYSIHQFDKERILKFLKHYTAYYSITTELLKLNPDLLSAKRGSYADATYTCKILEAANIICPPISKNLIKKYLDYCILTGYLPEKVKRSLTKDLLKAYLASSHGKGILPQFVKLFVSDDEPNRNRAANRPMHRHVDGYAKTADHMNGYNVINIEPDENTADYNIMEQKSDISMEGIEIGAVSVKWVCRKNGENQKVVIERHEGNPRKKLEELFKKHPGKEQSNVVITGLTAKAFLDFTYKPETECFEKALQYYDIKPDILLSLGGENFILYTVKNGQIRNMFTTSKCAAGTGEFIVQQLQRMNMNLEEGVEASRGGNVVSLSTRCSVYCKSDATHKLNKGECNTADIAKSLIHDLATKVIKMINLSQWDKRSIVISGGISLNHPFVEILKDELSESEFIVLRESACLEAFGASLFASELTPEGAAVDRVKRLKQNVVSHDILPPLKGGEELLDYRVNAGKTGEIVAGGNYILGVDTGSTTTKAVLYNIDGKTIDAGCYLRTHGNPVAATQNCVKELIQQVNHKPIKIIQVGVTGSGRDITSVYLDNCLSFNEILTHARAASQEISEVDTVFEIGGQDSKFISFLDGVPVDYAMNEGCSAGTGSFLEESVSVDMGIPVKEISHRGEKSLQPIAFGERCAAFINTDLRNALQQGASQEDVIGGLVYSIANNYISRIVGVRSIGKTLLFQGGVALNKSVALAMAVLTGRRVVVPPHPELMGCVGTALMISDKLNARECEEKAYRLEDFVAGNMEEKGVFQCKSCENVCEIKKISVNGKIHPFGGLCSKYENKRIGVRRSQEGKDLVAVKNKMMFEEFGSVPVKNPRGTIGVPMALGAYEFFPFYAKLINELGFEVVQSCPSEAGKSKIKGPICYPCEIVHSHVHDLLEKRVDFIFLPKMMSWIVPDGYKCSKFCPPSLMIPDLIRSAFEGSEHKILSPHINFRQKEIDSSLKRIGGMGKALGIRHKECNKAGEIALNHYHLFHQKYIELGRYELERMGGAPTVIISGKPYVTCSSEVNIGLPKKITTRGYNIIPEDMLPDYEPAKHPRNMWRYTQKMINALSYAKLKSNLFICYVSCFSCGPDAVMYHQVREELAGQTFCYLEIDSHTGHAGFETRVGAFLDIIEEKNKSGYSKIYSPVTGGMSHAA